MKQVRVLDDVHKMLEEIVKHEKESGRIGVSKQLIVNELIIAKHKKVSK